MSANGATKRDLFRVISERDATIAALQSENERLKETALTETERRTILNLVRHHQDCTVPRDCQCGLWAIQNRLRRISSTSEETS